MPILIPLAVAGIMVARTVAVIYADYQMNKWVDKKRQEDAEKAHREHENKQETETQKNNEQNETNN
jgi:mannitol-specific phosphotransferase system IIBC component